jgi:hypothetical protein
MNTERKLRRAHCSSLAHAGASVRTALRSRAERARGFAASSRSDGETGLATRSNVGSRGSTHGTVARTGRRSAAAFAEEALDDPVLEAVEGDDRQPAAGLQRALGGARPCSSSSSSAFRWMRIAWKVRVAGSLFWPWAEAGGAADDRGQLGGALDRPGGDDGAGDRPGARLLAIVAQDPGDLGLVGR